MRPTLALRFLLSALSLITVLPHANAADAAPVAVAVLDFDSTDSKLKEQGLQLAQLLTARLSGQDDIITVERQDLAKLLGEQELGNSGLVDPQTAARIGQLTGARVLITGRLFNAAGETNLVLKVMSAETSRIFGLTSNYAVNVPPAEPIEKLAVNVATLLREKRSSLIANVLTREDRIARVKQKVAGRPLPTLAISIPEQHLGPRVIDPAAETEIGLILGQAGFTILGGEAAANADYRISGEAFSEAGLRRGNLLSCRARVEIKAVARKGGQVVLMDRQTTVGIDTAEHIAAKTALQEAGAALAERLADKLLVPLK
jgi:Curli production assembly/transport component CsgG